MRVSFAYIYTHDNDDINGSINVSPDKVAHCMHKIIDMQLMTNNLDHIKLSVKKRFLNIQCCTNWATQHLGRV